MNEIFNIVWSTLFPMEWATHPFMRNAFLAVLAVSPIFGLLGTHIVSNRMAFFSDALGHSALTGIAIGVILGMTGPLWAMVLFACIFSLAILWVKNHIRASADTVIGVFSSAFVALGIVLLSRGRGFSRYTSYLIGDILGITPVEIEFLFLLLIAVLVLWALFYNRFLVMTVNPALARSRNIPTKFLESLFVLALALSVTLSIRWVGLLIINAMLLLPAASARNFSRNVREYHFFSVLTGMVSGISGLLLSYYLDTDAGASIVLINFAFFLLSFGIRRLRGIH